MEDVEPFVRFGRIGIRGGFLTIILSDLAINFQGSEFESPLTIKF